MIKIGMIGAGGIAASHSNAIKENPDCILCAVCDIDKEKAEKIASLHGAKVYENYKDVDGVDAVIINLPHYLHCDVSCHFLEMGINVLCEKPMANTLEECEKMIAAADKSGAKLAVGHVQKYYSAVRELKKIIENEQYGKLCMINEVRNVDYVPGRAKWFLTKELAGGGILVNYGAHSLDRIFYTTGRKVQEINAALSNPLGAGDVEINAHILAKLEGDVTASITFCGCHVPEEYEVSYYFTDGAVKIKDGYNLFLFANGKWREMGGEKKLMERQLEEFVKFLKGEESEVVLAQYGKEIVKILESVINGGVTTSI